MIPKAPPAELLEGDGNVIGLAYYLQKWFRFHLQDWITQRSRELESKEGVYSLEAWTEARAGVAERFDESSPFLEQVVNADGDFTDDHGTVLAADVQMMRKPLDISQMTLDWVQQTDDSLFGDFSRGTAAAFFVREMDRTETVPDGYGTLV